MRAASARLREGEIDRLDTCASGNAAIYNHDHEPWAGGRHFDR